MKRFLMFLLLGPTGAAAAYCMYTTTAGVPWSGVEKFVAVCLFGFTFLVGAIVAPIDGLLAPTLPVLVRAPMVAMVGAGIPLGVICLFHGCVVAPELLLPSGIGSGVCMGVCSLLSNDRQPATVTPAGV